MKRRDLIKAGLAAGAMAALPLRAAAQAGGPSARDRKLFELVRSELARMGSHVWRSDIVGVADFGLHSSQRRFHFVDLERERVASYHVSHGDGSDGEHDGWLKRYSNLEGSHATSRGAYTTRSWYMGRFGMSIRLDGLDPTNSNALDRAIVMHKAQYATPEHVDRWGRLGRSNGCLAMGPEQFDRALIDLAGGRLVLAGSYGIAEDGSTIAPPVQQIDLLRPETENTFQRTNPGVY
jgi:hypothetical protein